MITTYDTTVTDAPSEILREKAMSHHRCTVLHLCDERKDLKKKQYEAEGAKEYREENKRIQKEVQKAKTDWIGNQCKENENCLDKSNRAYKQVRDLTSDKQGRSSTSQDRSGKCLTKEQEILNRWKNIAQN